MVNALLLTSLFIDISIINVLLIIMKFILIAKMSNFQLFDWFLLRSKYRQALKRRKMFSRALQIIIVDLQHVCTYVMLVMNVVM